MHRCGWSEAKNEHWHGWAKGTHKYRDQSLHEKGDVVAFSPALHNIDRAIMPKTQKTTLPIVFLPGFLETRHIWQHVVAALRIDADRAELLDLPGHTPGEDKQAVLRKLTNGDWLQFVANSIRTRFDGQKAIIVGHSTGGMLALQLGHRHPELVESIMLIGALSKGDRGRWLDPGARLLEMPLLGKTAFRAALKIWLHSSTSFQRGYAIAARHHRVQVPAPDSMRHQLRACDPMALHAVGTWILQSDIHKDLAGITCPILAIIGTRDRVVPPAHQISIIRAAPKAIAKLVPAGHLPYAECPDQVINALRRWQRRSWTDKPRPNADGS